MAGGIEITIEATGLADAVRRLNALGSPALGAQGLAALGGLIESQTRRRIQEDKTGPDGQPWAPWSQRYAATHRQGQSLLQSTGALVDSLAWTVDGDALRVGSNLVYAAVQQFGSAFGPHVVEAHDRYYRSSLDAEDERTPAFKGREVRTLAKVRQHARESNIPARPYLGVSDADAAEINEAIGDWIGGLLQ